MPLLDAVKKIGKTGATIENQGADVKYMGCVFDDCLCVILQLT